MLLDKERHDIDNFYVGELYITEQVEKNLFEPPKENHFDKHYKQIELIIKGAVDLQSGKYVLDDVDWGNRVRYYKVLTIFYKNNDNYLCLHDGNIYKTDTEDFVNNVVPLSSLLPKIGYNIPKRINTSKALFMFEQLFNKTILLDKIYNNAKYKIENFYVGTLVLNTEILPFGKKIEYNR